MVHRCAPMHARPGGEPSQEGLPAPRCWTSIHDRINGTGRHHRTDHIRSELVVDALQPWPDWTPATDGPARSCIRTRGRGLYPEPLLIFAPPAARGRAARLNGPAVADPASINTDDGTSFLPPARSQRELLDRQQWPPTVSSRLASAMTSSGSQGFYNSPAPQQPHRALETDTFARRPVLERPDQHQPCRLRRGHRSHHSPTVSGSSGVLGSC